MTLYTDAPRSIDGVRVLPKTDTGAPMEVANSLLDLVGNTPLVRLDRMGRDLTCHLVAKLEFMNAGGSVKDRPALAMIEAAEQAGLLKEGGTIVEPTSGNTGVGLAIVAARRHYKCVFVMPDKMAPEKISLLRAYGAEVIVCPTAVSPEHPDSYYSVAQRLSEEIPGAFRPNQYANPANPASHVATTGPEIWRQTAGRVTHFVAGVGTGGTISGVGQYLKSQNPDIQIIGADPEGSVYSGGSGRPYLVEGIGEDFWPTTYDPSVVDRVVMVSDQDSFGTARRVTREEGILVGGSAGTAVWAAVHIGHELGPEHVVVVLIPDSGRGYLSKLYNDSWMADFGFLRSTGQTVGDVLHRKTGDLPKLVHVHPDETVRDAIGILREYGVSQMPVVSAEPPIVAAEVRGAVHERDLDAARLLRSGRPRPTPGRCDVAAAPDGRQRRGGRAGGRAARGRGRGARARVRASDRDPDPFGRPRLPRRPEPRRERPELGRCRRAPSTPAGTTTLPRARSSPRSTWRPRTSRRRRRSTRASSTAGRATRTRAVLERALAELEGGRFAFAFASGLAAEDALLRTVPAGGHIVIPHDAYGGTYRLAARVHDATGLRFTAVDLSDPAALEAAFTDGTAMVWCESPTNPTLSVVDIAAVAAVARGHGARLVVDNTFATPVLQQPLALGADVVIHSSTKYLGGHSDVVGGAAITNDEALAERIGYLQNAAGAVPSPFDCWLLLRGPAHARRSGSSASRRTLGPSQRSSSRAAAVAKVLYPGFGGMVSFLAAGGEDAAVNVCTRTELFTLAESLGRGRVADRAPGAHDACVGRRHGERGRRLAGAPVVWHRSGRRPHRRPQPGAGAVVAGLPRVEVRG